MTEQNNRAVVARIRGVGMTSWSVLGVIGLVVVIALAISAVSGILIPLVLAAVIGIALEPVSEKLQARGVPSTLAAVLTLLLAIATVIGMIVLVVWGFVQQWPEIYGQLTDGWNDFVTWGRSLDVDTALLERAREGVEEMVPQVASGVAGAVTSTFYGTISLIMGTFFGAFFLFFVLRDGHRFSGWFARETRFDADTVHEVVEIVRLCIRGYFRGTAITAIVTAPIFMIPLLILGIPLPVPIFVLYFFLSFIPFLGAWITGAFVVLIAFGTGGATAAAIMAVTFLVSNGTIQSAVSSWALGSSLKLHPVSVLLATMIGGTIAGLIGMILGAPLLAATVKSIEAVRARHRQRDAAHQATAAPPDPGTGPPFGDLPGAAPA